MIKMLPFKEPLIDTYQGSSFVQGIILAHPNLLNSIMNTYINITCVETEDIHEMLLQFANVLWDDFAEDGVFSTNEIYIKDIIAKENIVECIKEQINLGNYPALHHIDDYYLSYTSKYLKTHYVHDTYIIGYEEDEFVVVAYTHKKYKIFKIKEEEIGEALKSAAQIYDESTLIFLEAKAVNTTIDLERIAGEYKDYLYGNRPKNNSPKMVYGENIYAVLVKCLQNLAKHNGEDGFSMDLRTMKVLWEHKRLLLRNITILNGINPIFESEIETLKDVEKRAHTIWNLSIMWKFKKDAKTIERIIPLVEALKEVEKNAVQSVIERLGEWISNDIAEKKCV